MRLATAAENRQRALEILTPHQTPQNESKYQLRSASLALQPVAQPHGPSTNPSLQISAMNTMLAFFHDKFTTQDAHFNWLSLLYTETYRVDLKDPLQGRSIVDCLLALNQDSRDIRGWTMELKAMFAETRIVVDEDASVEEVGTEKEIDGVENLEDPEEKADNDEVAQDLAEKTEASLRLD